MDTPPLRQASLRPAVSAARQSFSPSFLLFVLGGLVGLANMLLHPVPFGWGFEMVSLAQNLARHGAFSNPFFLLDTGPSAFCPPLYPFLLSIVMRLVRQPRFVLLLATFGAILANAFTAEMLPRISLVLFQSARPGIVAALFWLLAAQLMPNWDANWTVFTVLLFCLVSAAAVQPSARRASAIAGSLLAAVLFLLNPYSLFVFLPFVLWLAAKAANKRRAAAYLCLVCVAAGSAGLAWGIRNSLVFGTFFERTSLGITLRVSNNDCASPGFPASEATGCYAAYAPNLNRVEAQKLRDLDELNYDRLRLAETKAWIAAHRGRFARLTLARIWDFWFPPVIDFTPLAMYPFPLAVVSVGTLLSLPGLILLLRKRPSTAAFFAFVFLVYPLMYYVVVSDIRYRYPMLWLTFLAAGYFLVWLARTLRALISRSTLVPSFSGTTKGVSPHEDASRSAYRFSDVRQRVE